MKVVYKAKPKIIFHKNVYFKKYKFSVYDAFLSKTYLNDNNYTIDSSRDNVVTADIRIETFRHGYNIYTLPLI